MLIDTHAHVIPRDYPAGSPSCFPSMEPVPGDTAHILVSGDMRFTAKEVFFDAERRIEAMDANGVPLQSMDLEPEVLGDITWNNAFRFLGIDPAQLVGA